MLEFIRSMIGLTNCYDYYLQALTDRDLPSEKGKMDNCVMHYPNKANKLPYRSMIPQATAKGDEIP